MVSIYDAMKKNPPKQLEEYIVGALRYRKVLLKVSKRFWN
jgi:hypothetical protein